MQPGVATRPPNVGSAQAEILSAFLRCCDSMPEHLALLDQNDSWSYREALAGALLVARHLRACGVQSDDIVAVGAARCAAFAVCVTGVLLAGARFVVVDLSPEHPLQRQRLAALLQPRYWLVLEDLPSGADSLAELAPRSHWTKLPTGKAALMRALHELPLAPQQHWVDTRRDGARAYLIATSGTTGTPKVVSTRHDSVCNFLNWYVERFELSAPDRFALLSGLAHDPVVRDVFAPLSIGAALCVPTEALRRDPSKLLEWLHTCAVSVVHLTPPMLDALAGAAKQSAVLSVRLLGCGGDRLTRRHVAAARRLFPRAQLVNFYGASETPQVIAYHCVDPAVSEGSQQGDAAQDNPPIGTPIRGWDLLLLDADLQPCAAEKPGELYARSRFLSEGYVGQPQLTRERYLRTDTPDEVLFRTGDMACRGTDGLLRVLGRQDRQVKIIGHRVDLSEVESELCTHPSVAQVTVTFDAGSAVLSAYVVPAKDCVFSAEALRVHMAATGASYLIPTRMVRLEAMPLNANGKVDHAALASAGAPSPAQPAAPDPDTLFESVRRIWSQVLQLPAINVDASFQELGGNSLQAAQIAEEATRSSGVAVRGMHLFIYPTLQTFTGFIRQGSQRKPARCVADMHADITRRRGAILRAKVFRGELAGE